MTGEFVATYWTQEITCFVDHSGRKARFLTHFEKCSRTVKLIRNVHIRVKAGTATVKITRGRAGDIVTHFTHDTLKVVWSRLNA